MPTPALGCVPGLVEEVPHSCCVCAGCINRFEALSNALLLFQLYATRVDEGNEQASWSAIANTVSYK